MAVGDVQGRPCRRRRARSATPSCWVFAARDLHVPVLLAEQYPKGLDHTVPEIAAVAQGFPVLEKLHFSCMETDATSSRSLESDKACLDRLSALGAGIVTTEMVIFEWMGRAGTETFRKLLPLIK